MSISRPVENSLMDWACNDEAFKQIFLVGLSNTADRRFLCIAASASALHRIIAAPFFLALALLDIPFWIGKTVVLLCTSKLTCAHFKNFPRHLLTIVFLFPCFVGYVPIGMRGKTDRKIRAVIKKFQNREYGDLSIAENNTRRTFRFVKDLEQWYEPEFGYFRKEEDRFYYVIRQLLIETNYSTKPDPELGVGLKGSISVNQLIKDLLDARYSDGTLPWQAAKGFINLIMGNCVALPKPFIGERSEEEQKEASNELEKGIEQQIELLKIVLTAAGKKTECSWTLHQKPYNYGDQDTRKYHVFLLMGLVQAVGMQKFSRSDSYKRDGRVCRNGDKPFANKDCVFAKLLKESIVTGNELKEFEEYVELLKRFLDEFSEALNLEQQQKLSEEAEKGNVAPIDGLIDKARHWFDAHKQNPYICLMQELPIFVGYYSTNRMDKFEALKLFCERWCDTFKERADAVLKLKGFLLQGSLYHKEAETKLLVACPTLAIGSSGNSPITDIIFEYMS